MVITNGIFNDKELRLLVSFDENDNAIDLVDLDSAMVGTNHVATVEKVLNDIEACIVKLDCGEKGFIEFKKLVPESFLERHSEKKLVCQADKFYVKITQDKKSTKPYSCSFVNPADYKENDSGFIQYYIENYATDNAQIITDLQDVAELDLNVRYYSDDEVSLWQLYGLTKLVDVATSKVVHLKSGSNIVIEPTEAMTIIDVNSSKNYGKSSAYETNMEALKEIAHQLRLRAISGIIIVDLLKLSKEEEANLIHEAKAFFADDISKVAIHGFTHLGLLEITRSRNFSPFKI